MSQFCRHPTCRMLHRFEKVGFWRSRGTRNIESHKDTVGLGRTALKHQNHNLWSTRAPQVPQMAFYSLPGPLWAIFKISGNFFPKYFGDFKISEADVSTIREELFGWIRQKKCWVRAKFARFLLDFGSVSLFLQGFCLKIPKFWVRWWKSAELASKFAWVRPKNRSELGAQNRKKNLIGPCCHL